MNGNPYSPLKAAHHRHRLDVLKSGGQPVPSQIQLVISDRCNQNCNFCAYRLDGYSSNELFKIIHPDGSVDNNPKRFIPLAKCLEILDDCAEMGVGAVQITGGGEPTVHPDHQEIFDAVVSRGLDFALVTNGWAIRDSILDTLMKATWMRVSVDAGNVKTYATTRHVPESAFAKVLSNIGKIRDVRDKVKSKMILGVGFVVTADNWREIVEGTRQAKDAGADNVRISAMFQPEDEAYFSDFFRQASDLCREAQSMADSGFQVFNNFGDRLDDLKQHSPDYSFCGYQHFSTYIAGTLDVFRCCVQAYNPRGLIGSIKDQRFKDLWESQHKRDDFAAFDARECERCMFNNKNRTINYLLSDEPAHVNFV